MFARLIIRWSRDKSFIWGVKACWIGVECMHVGCKRKHEVSGAYSRDISDRVLGHRHGIVEVVFGWMLHGWFKEDLHRVIYAPCWIYYSTDYFFHRLNLWCAQTWISTSICGQNCVIFFEVTTHSLMFLVANLTFFSLVLDLHLLESLPSWWHGTTVLLFVLIFVQLVDLGISLSEWKVWIMVHLRNWLGLTLKNTDTIRTTWNNLIAPTLLGATTVDVSRGFGDILSIIHHQTWERIQSLPSLDRATLLENTFSLFDSSCRVISTTTGRGLIALTWTFLAGTHIYLLGSIFSEIGA